VAALAFRRSPPCPIVGFPSTTHIDNQMVPVVSTRTRIVTMATVPSVTDCRLAHENIKTDSPEIKKLAGVLARAERGSTLVRVYASKGGHVYFSHKSAIEVDVTWSDLPRRSSECLYARERVHWTMVEMQLIAIVNTMSRPLPGLHK